MDFKDFRAGRKVRGPGTETSDSIPALLSKNEFVIKAKSAKKIGFDKLKHMNRTGEIPMRMQMKKSNPKQASDMGAMRGGGRMKLKGFQAGGHKGTEAGWAAVRRHPKMIMAGEKREALGEMHESNKREREAKHNLQLRGGGRLKGFQAGGATGEGLTPTQRQWKPLVPGVGEPKPAAATSTGSSFTNDQMNMRLARDMQQGPVAGSIESIKRRVGFKGGGRMKLAGYQAGGEPEKPKDETTEKTPGYIKPTERPSAGDPKPVTPKPVAPAAKPKADTTLRIDTQEMDRRARADLPWWKRLNKGGGLRGYAGGGHPGFKAVAAKIGKQKGIRNPGAVLAAASRGASAKAKKANPRLNRVK